MNVRMWLHKATQNNFKILIDYGYKFIGPETGEMACGEYGEGKMSSPRQILSYLKNYFDLRDVLKKKKISALITTGSTREHIDPVRYISNQSSGKQGYEIALALSKIGVKTNLIAANSNFKPSKNLKIIKVETADEMFETVKNLLPVDIAICVAAVTDFKVKKVNKNKIKKDDLSYLQLEKNIDILNYLGKNNKLRPKFVIGFSAETENLIKNSLNKLRNKHCDLIIANDVSKKDFGFNVDYNKVSIINKNGEIESIPKSKKSYIASVISKKIVDKFLINDKDIN